MPYPISIIIEAYNEEHNALAEHTESIDALLKQDYPLEDVELLLIGSEEQLANVAIPSKWAPFGTVRQEVVPAQKNHYWQQKNYGAKIADGVIIAWLDSDVAPDSTWLAAIVSAIENGADVSVGPSMYRSEKLGSRSPLMLAAGFVSWSFVLSSQSKPQKPLANSLLAHNVGILRDMALKVPFRTGKRSYPSSLLYFDLKRTGAKISFQPGQKAVHSVTLNWWITRRHFRTGWETYDARKSDTMWPRVKPLERVPWIEPIILRGGLVLRDLVHWFRYRHVMDINLLAAWCMLPLVLLASMTARTAEIAGMYAALIAPRRSAHQARF